MAHEPEDGHRLFLTTLPAGAGERRLALAVLLGSLAVFLALVPFAKQPVGQVWPFIPIYQSAFVISDLITAILLFGQFGFLRSRALLVLASGYLYTAFMASAHALTFPGLFAPTGLLGAGPHSTAWMYMFWHAGFPLAFVAYALLKDGPGTDPEARRLRIPTGLAVLSSAVLVVLGGAALTALATRGQGLLPALMRGNQYEPAQIVAIHTVWLSSVAALAALWWRRPHSVLDVWLMVVVGAWFFDVGLSGVFNAARFDLGFYAGRIYGLLAATFVLAVLLVENGRLYRRLVAAHEGERRERQRAEEKTAELQDANQELEAFAYSVSHDLRAPLRAMDGFAQILEEDYGSRLDTEGRRLLGVVRASSQQMARLIDDLLAFSRLGRQPLRTVPVRVDEVAHQVLAELGAELDGRPIQLSVGALPIAEADPALLRQALANLLGNAIKFTRSRDPAVIEVGARTEAGRPPVYYVKDNGVGFDMRYAHKLFGVFERLHRAAEYEGTGIGLAIVKRVIERHGGRVWAHATPGTGATFSFTLAPGPRAESPAPAATA
jgi:signal transduction histidine kinase